MGIIYTHTHTYLSVLKQQKFIISHNETAQFRLGLGTHCLLIEITHLVSGLNEAQVLYVSAQKEFSERQSDR